MLILNLFYLYYIILKSIENRKYDITNVINYSDIRISIRESETINKERFNIDKSICKPSTKSNINFESNSHDSKQKYVPQANWSDIKRMLIQVDKFIENLANFEFYNFP